GGSATSDVYSVPWLPATSATTGPGRVPLTTAMGRSVAESTPAGTRMAPLATCPRLALAVPTAAVARASGCLAASPAGALSTATAGLNGLWRVLVSMLLV